MKFTITFQQLENWVRGAENYVDLAFERLFFIMVIGAPIVEEWMRANAPWKDECMPGKEYLRAVAYRDDTGRKVGIAAFYDMVMYNQNCPDQDVTFDFSIEHEFRDFTDAGKIAILNPRWGGTTVFDKPFPDVVEMILREFNG